ncbi:putative bifunctional diguanylate cyclase/phosphodiesterase [Vreelandella sulfidaeris]|uniref:putative bifunctional diguanylate cyclase/phosphodiesterase n=1 Tax=Vreelandella sulfidaeris TaxID=115553 RepID=UPI0035F0B78E
MPINSRVLALETLLLMVAAALLFMGVAGLALGMGAQESLFAAALVPDAALITLLLGIGLLAALQYWRRLRQLSAGVLLAILVYSVVHNQWAGGQAGSWLTGHLRITSGASVVLMVVALCMYMGFSTSRRRGCWLATGIVLWLFTGVVIYRLWSGIEVENPLFSSSPVAVVVFAMLLASALVTVGVRQQSTSLNPGRWTMIVALTGVAISSVVWLLLSMQQHVAAYQQASYLLDNVQLNAEQAMRTHLNQMQRMAERLETAGGDVEGALLATDSQHYLRDMTSLKAIALLNEDNHIVWSTIRSPDEQYWLRQQTLKQSVVDWLGFPLSQPRLIIPDENQPERMLLAAPILNSPQTLLASFDLASLLNDELRMALGPYQISVNREEQSLFILHPSGFNADQLLTPEQALASRRIGLPGGVSLILYAYPGAHYNWYLMSFMPVSVAMGGLLLSWLLAFCFGQVGMGIARTRELTAAQHLLAESKQRYRSLFTHHPDAVFSLDQEGRFVSANERCAVITGYSNSEILDQHFAHFINADDIARVGHYFLLAMQGQINRFELPLIDRDGQHHLLDVIALPISINDNIVGIYGIAQDVTSSREQQVRLRTLERSVEASVNGVLIADANLADMPIVYANKAFTHMTGYTQEDVIGKNCRFLQGPETDPAIIAQMRQHIDEQRDIHVTLCNYRKDGTPFWNDLYISPVRDQDGNTTHFVGVQHDISKHKAYEAQLTYQARHDALTQLPNRALFEDTLLARFNLLQQGKHRLAVLFVDLDDFKPINDNLGHAIGDRVLTEVAKRLQATLAPSDTVARLGGDEFVILHADIVDEAQVVELAECILSVLARPYCMEGEELYLTASIGIALSQQETLEPKTLIQQADMAMYKAKQQGRNAYEWFTHAFTDTVSERMVLRNDLQEAIEAQAFELYYQPLLNRHGQLVSVEALLRWQHPSKGFISPARFIPLAETTGQIMPISEWVLTRACRDMQALKKAGFGSVRVAVNLSPLQFHRTNFLSTLRQTLQDTALAPAQLSLELTEGILMNNTEAAIETLQALRSMQVGVSIDDFGTGFSSLSYLKDLPISTVKIDRSFIQELTHSSDDAAIVQGIISMAHHLGLQVVAEGVETEEQHLRLMAYQCDIFQGFGLAKPMPLEALKVFIRSLASGAVIHQEASQ